MLPSNFSVDITSNVMNTIKAALDIFDGVKFTGYSIDEDNKYVILYESHLNDFTAYHPFMVEPTNEDIASLCTKWLKTKANYSCNDNGDPTAFRIRSIKYGHVCNDEYKLPKFSWQAVVFIEPTESLYFK